MTHPNKSEIVIILDRSGSMGTIRNDIIGGFNTFIEEQRKALPGEVNVTLITFNQTWKTVFDRIPLNKVSPLTAADYVPNGMTALLDAMGTAIDNLGQRLAGEPENERPSLVIISVMTDGYENSSKEYTKPQLMQKITTQQDTYNWKFVFLGANQDAIQEARDLGINPLYSASIQLHDACAVQTSYRGFAKSVQCVYADAGKLKDDDDKIGTVTG